MKDPPKVIAAIDGTPPDGFGFRTPLWRDEDDYRTHDGRILRGPWYEMDASRGYVTPLPEPVEAPFGPGLVLFDPPNPPAFVTPEGAEERRRGYVRECLQTARDALKQGDPVAAKNAAREGMKVAQLRGEEGEALYHIYVVATPHRYRELAIHEMESMTGRSFWSSEEKMDSMTEPGWSGATPSTVSPNSAPGESQSSPTKGLKT